MSEFDPFNPFDDQSMEQIRALQDVARERARQDEKWGEQNHTHPHWATILGEEYGEACKEVNEIATFDSSEFLVNREPLREELIQVAAVAVAWVEYLDRLESPASC